MSNNRYTIWSIILFLLGFYTRGFVDLLFSFQRIGFTSNVDSLKNNKTFIKQYWQQKGDEIDLTSNSVTSNSKTRGNDHMGRTHWCIIASKFLPRTTRNHFDHFPHTSEIILPCWSYFVEQGVTNRCGFAIASKNYKFPQWIKELIDAMGCEIRESDKGLPKDNIVDFVPADDVQFIPNYYLLRPRLDYIRYLNHPEHAHMLRRLYVDDEYIAQVKGDGKPIQIGIIQRQGARQINNLDEIHMTLKQDIPHGNITVTDFSFKTVKEQAIWFATKDVIIASHGAALTNSIFITPGTIVMQLYKPGYFLQTLEPLIEQSGGIAIQWYKKGINPYIESHKLNIENHEEFEEIGQSGGFSVPPEEISDRVRAALGLEMAGVSFMRRMFGKGNA